MIDRKKKLVVYSPIPSISSSEEYKKIVKYVKKNNLHPNTGLPLVYSKDKYATWDAYKKHNEELSEWKDRHIEIFMREIGKKIVVDYDVVDCVYPSQRGSALFAGLTKADTLFVHCHGNTHVIGTGPFVMQPEVLAENLLALGLVKVAPPVIVIWSCNSGTPEGDESYAGLLMKTLESKGCLHPVAIGIDAKLFAEQGARNSVLTFFKERPARLGPRIKAMRESEVIEVNASPNTISSANIEKKDRLFTVLEKLKKSRIYHDNRSDTSQSDFDSSESSIDSGKDNTSDDSTNAESKNKSRFPKK